MSDATAAPDPAIARAEARLAYLRELTERELTEIGMNIARALEREVLAAAAHPADAAGPDDDADTPPVPARNTRPGRDPADSFARISRANRLTITLEARVEEQLAARLAGEPARREAARAEAARRTEAETDARKTARRERVTALVRDVIDREAGDGEAWFHLLEALDERLRLDAAYDDLDTPPIQRIVKHLCDDLMLTPDWRRWTGEGWAPAEPFWRTPSSSFHRRSRIPIDDLIQQEGLEDAAPA